jgi:hypothetical protein
MKKLIFLCALALMTGLLSCKKNLLDSVPQSQYTDVAVFKDSTLTNLYINKIYADMPAQFDGNNVTDMLSNYTDESTNISATAVSGIYDQNQYTSGTYPYGSTLYGGFYADIRLCNVFLENIGQLNASTGLKNRLTGEVRFLRALYYHYLYNYFGRFPIVKTSLQLGSSSDFVPRGTDADCISFITSELTAAASLLPVKYTGADVGRATKGAAYALLSRTYLYNGQWQNASDAAKQVMNLGVYSLFADYQGIFYPQNDNNSEVIFDRQYISTIAGLQYSLIDFYNNPATFTGKSTGNTDPSENLVSLYQMKDGTAFDWTNPVEAANPYANRDPRLEASIIHDGTVWEGKTIDMKAGSLFNPSARPCPTGYYMKKFLNPAYSFTDATNYSGQNFILIRYAEVLLNYAEAQFKLGNTEEARTSVNIIRARPSVNMPPISAANFTFTSYMNEREVELAFEGLRLWDINRWQLGLQTRGSDLYGVSVTVSPANVRTYQKVVALKGGTQRIFDPKMYLFPIPLSEIQKYPANTLVQNTGW